MRIRYLLFFLIAIAAFSCTKEEDVKAITAKKADSMAIASNLNLTRPNTLAVSGTLTVTVKDSTYTFDAKDDSIAVVNIYLDNQKYFGITAVNKAHTMSFGISSPGYAADNTTKNIAGGQFLLSSKELSNEYTLSQNTDVPEPGKIILTQYSRDSVLAKGTFVTYLGPDVKTTSPFYKVEGSFSLKIK
jgi:uncharacterized protein YdeI (BOF family)